MLRVTSEFSCLNVHLESMLVGQLEARLFTVSFFVGFCSCNVNVGKAVQVVNDVASDPC